MGEITVAFRINGGLGTHLIQANYLKCFYDKFSQYPIKITVFGHSSEQINDALFQGQNFVFEYTVRNQYVERGYDLIVDLRFFCRVVSCNEKKLSSEAPDLYDLVQFWVRFQNDRGTRPYFKLLPECDFNIYTYARIKGMTRFNIADVDGRLGVGNDYRMEVKIFQPEERLLGKLGLRPKQYITLQRGANVGNHVYDSPKLWPQNYYDRLVHWLKNNYRKYTLVQLGSDPEHTAEMQDIDLNLVGKTTLDDIKVLLKNSMLHIDGECGLVHLRKALKGGPSVVLFGPTPIYHFAYDGNINIRNTTCPESCASLFDAWQRKCLLHEKPLCMYELTPEIVEAKIDDFMKGKMQKSQKFKSKLEKIIAVGEIHFNQQWVSEWLSKYEIYDYKVIKIALHELRCQLFNGVDWDVVRLIDHPAYQYLCGNENAYTEYMELNKKYNPDHVHSVTRFQNLVKELECNGFHEKEMLVVNGKLKLMDGIHRACWLLKKYGGDYEIQALRVYGNFNI